MIRESIVINRDVATVYSAFSSLEFWQQVLTDILDVKVRYNDSHHQEFLMTVQRPKGPETIRGIWFCKPNRSIELFQPEPPPGFKRMTGVWTFEEANGGTQVSVKRQFELLPSDSGPTTEEVAAKLREFLQRNLNLFKAQLEYGHEISAS